VPKRRSASLLAAAALAAALAVAAPSDARRVAVSAATPPDFEWLARGTASAGPVQRRLDYGNPGDRPVVGDWNGDGQQTPGLQRGGTWFQRDSFGTRPSRTFAFGRPGDVPVAGDWDGDGHQTPGVYRAGTWYLRNANSSGSSTRATLGRRPGDVPVAGDWDGDGRDTVGLYRNGTWYLRDTLGSGPLTSFRFGRPGDVPVVGDWDGDGRDTVGLYRNGRWLTRNADVGGPTTSFAFGAPGDAPVVGDWDGDGHDGIAVVRARPAGVSYRVITTGPRPAVAHIVTVRLADASTVDTALAGDRLGVLEPTSSMARRHQAVVAVNADYALPTGRPVHTYAEDGRLVQTTSTRGPNLATSRDESVVNIGFPTVRVTLGQEPVQRMNQGSPQAGELAGFTAAGASLPGPAAGTCTARMGEAAQPVLGDDGRARTLQRVSAVACPGRFRPAGGQMVVAARSTDPRAAAVRALAPGRQLDLAWSLGFPNVFDAVGGNPVLVQDGRIVRGNVQGSGPFFAPNPRTGVGRTSDGHLLLVVVDGRQPGYSGGMTLAEFAQLFVDLGADRALNLDGGGSSTVWVNGWVRNRPSDGHERPVADALLVLPGADPGEHGVPRPPTAAATVRSADALQAAGRDPASTGGLADWSRRRGGR